MPRNNNIQFRRGTYSQWDAVSTGILASGEPGLITDFLLLKVGDGNTQWGDLVALNDNLRTVVRNDTASTIPKMSVVYINGAQGDIPRINLAIASGEGSSALTHGITVNDITSGGVGVIINEGTLKNLNTLTGFSGVNPGTTLWLSPTVSGGLTTTKPYAPNHAVSVGTLIRVHQTQGVINVKIDNGFELEELHDVAVTGATNGQFLQYNSASGLWVPSSSGNFSTLQVNGTGVSVSGHTHTASQITDFNEAVDDRIGSGLFAAGTGINLNYNDGSNSFTVSVSGLINNPTNNRILTSRDSTTTGIDAETNATFDGTNFNISGVLNVDNLRLDGNTISSTNSNGNIIIQPSGYGALQRDGGGNARGQYAVDWQATRTSSTNVANGNYSVIGGGRSNTSSGIDSTVGGGKSNTSSGYASTVGGGWSNSASNKYSTVGGGKSNTASNYYSTVGGGQSNTSSGYFSTVGGGLINSASNRYSTVGGGRSNTASNYYSTIGGGNSNAASGYFSVIGGGNANISSLSYSTVGGGKSNTASNYYSTVGGGQSNIASGRCSTVAGGSYNTTSATHSNNYGTFGHGFVGGGDNNLNSSFFGVIGGGEDNTVSAAYSYTYAPSKGYATICGGKGNTVSGAYGFIGGGSSNTVSANYNSNAIVYGHGVIGGGKSNSVSLYAYYSTVGGGKDNTASASYSAIGGGLSNVASGSISTVGGGQANAASSTGSTVGGGFSNDATSNNSTVGGGYSNTASGSCSTVGGGSANSATNAYCTVGGGLSNGATNSYSTVGGGSSNTASGQISTVGGGYANTASALYSFVPGGNRAKATKHGEFAHAAGGFSNVAGTAQHTILVARETTTGSTANQILYLNDISNRLIIPAKTTWTFEIKLSAYNDTDSAGAGWIFRGAIRRNGSDGTALIGSIIEENWKDSAMSSTSASVVADDNNEALEIRVTGLTSKNIRWVAVVDISQVSYGTP